MTRTATNLVGPTAASAEPAQRASAPATLAGAFGPIEPGAGGPLYRRLTTLIRRAVDARKLAPGDALPAERELATQLGVSRVTVRKALQELVRGGVLEQRRGSGTYVAEHPEPVQQQMSRLTSFSEEMRGRGIEPGSRWLERSLAHPSPTEAIVLGLSPRDQVLRLARVRTADGLPMAVDRTIVPASILPSPEQVGISLYASLAAAGHRPVRALQRIRAVVLPPADAALLEMGEGAAAVDLERVAFDQGGRAIELTRSYYRGDAYDFVAELHITDPRVDGLADPRAGGGADPSALPTSEGRTA